MKLSFTNAHRSIRHPPSKFSNFQPEVLLLTILLHFAALPLDTIKQDLNIIVLLSKRLKRGRPWILRCMFISPHRWHIQFKKFQCWKRFRNVPRNRREIHASLDKTEVAQIWESQGTEEVINTQRMNHSASVGIGATQSLVVDIRDEL